MTILSHIHVASTSTKVHINVLTYKSGLKFCDQLCINNNDDCDYFIKADVGYNLGLATFCKCLAIQNDSSG